MILMVALALQRKSLVLTLLKQRQNFACACVIIVKTYHIKAYNKNLDFP